jgi:hypothetical protein
MERVKQKSKIFHNFKHTSGQRMLHAAEIIPRSRTLVERLTGPKLAKKFPAHYEMLRFITLTLSRAK